MSFLKKSYNFITKSNVGSLITGGTIQAFSDSF